MDPIDSGKVSGEGYEMLPDPVPDRRVTSVPLPPNQMLTDDKLFPKDGVPDWQLAKRYLQLEGRMSKAQTLRLCQ